MKASYSISIRQVVYALLATIVVFAGISLDSYNRTLDFRLKQQVDDFSVRPTLAMFYHGEVRWAIASAVGKNTMLFPAGLKGYPFEILKEDGTVLSHKGWGFSAIHARNDGASVSENWHGTVRLANGTWLPLQAAHWKVGGRSTTIKLSKALLEMKSY